jgi:oligopeptide/dipeptide ABC transporter ATP-binding protein
MNALLEIDDLRIALRGTTLLDGVSLSLAPGETLGVVGESGCGKSLLALAIMGLLAPGMRVTGRIMLGGDNLLGLSDRAMCAIRGGKIGMVFQEPMLALNPVQPVGRQIAEGMRVHLGLARAEAEDRARRLMERVGLDPALATAYPHRLSGGQRQRVMIATALACKPHMLIADEFSTALDMATQAQIVALLAELAAENQMALMLITHDLGLAAQIASSVLVLYAGRVAEAGTAQQVFRHPRHPYTHALLGATLHGRRTKPGEPLPNIPGQVPPPAERPQNCAFAPRCPRAQDDCRTSRPTLSAGAACFHPLAA